jgi:hypothetical protein
MSAACSQVQDLDLPQFVLLKNESKKTMHGNISFPSLPIQRPRVEAQRGGGSFNKNFNHFPASQHNNQYGLTFQIHGNRPYANKLSKRPNFIQNAVKFENQYINTNKYPNGYCLNSSPDKFYSRSCYGSTASESDSSSSHASSELNGFKIVHRGKIVHDETDEDVDSPSDLRIFLPLNSSNGKFASSEMVIGPIAKEISLPTFA